MNRPSKKLLLVWLLFSFVRPAIATEKNELAKLEAKYQKWIREEVGYIITPLEKQVFLKLQNDRERDIFIDAFWKQRDPTPGTTENEFKTEHARRLLHANEVYGRGTSTPGWQTDRGRVYIILGPPLSVQSFTTLSQIRPMEIWSYQQAPHGGLPSAFNLVFFDRRDSGDFVFYSPINDGPQKLLVDYEGKPDDYSAAYQQIKDVNAFIAENSLSLIPGDNTAVGRPSVSSDFLIQNITLLPQKEFKDGYAEKFLKFKDLVEVEYSTNYVESQSSLHLIRTPAGQNFIHYFIKLARLSVNQYEETFYTKIKLNGSVTGADGALVYQFEKSFEITLNAEQFENLKNSSFGIYDLFPIIPGNHRLVVLLKNEVSKEFSSLEKEIIVPDPAPAAPLMTPAVLAYQVNPCRYSPASFSPFAVGDRQLVLVTENILTRRDTLHLFLQVLGLNPELRQRLLIGFAIIKDEKETVLSQTLKLAECLLNDTDLWRQFPLADIKPGYYKLVVTLGDESQPKRIEQSRSFMVTPLNEFVRPQIFSKILSSPEGSLVNYILGLQYLNSGDIIRAEPLLESAAFRSPGTGTYAIGLSRVYLLQKKYSRIDSILQRFASEADPPNEVLQLLAASKQNQGDFGAARGLYQRSLSRFGLTVEGLNGIGFCQAKLGNPAEAEKAWKKSLEIQPDQPRIKNWLDSLKKQL